MAVLKRGEVAEAVLISQKSKSHRRLQISSLTHSAYFIKQANYMCNRARGYQQELAFVCQFFCINASVMRPAVEVFFDRMQQHLFTQ